MTSNGYDSDDDEQCGLIILGNSGVGKSFLANVLVGQEVFTHKFSSRSVTHNTEFKDIRLGELPLTIFNIPGLIEADQERINLNKKEIDKAFALRPNSIIMFVFGQQGGRICDEDVVAFNAINAAYPFHLGSLVLVINSLPKDRPTNYEGAALVVLQRLLKDTHVSNDNLCFIDEIDRNNPAERQYLKEKLLQVIVECNPSEHRKKQEIETLLDKLHEKARQMQELHNRMESEQLIYATEIENGQRLFNETMAKHRSEIESLKYAMQRQEELYAKQERAYQEQQRKHDIELQELRKQVEDAKKYYEELRENEAIHQQQLREAQEAIQRTQAALQTAIQQQSVPRRKKKPWWKIW